MGDWGTGIFQDDHALDTAADIREATDPNRHIEIFLRSFLQATIDGYDQSEHAEDWGRAREVMAICEIVRLGRRGDEAVPASLPRTVAAWLETSRFVPSDTVWTLAEESCGRLMESAWLKDDWPEIWDGSLAPLSRCFALESLTPKV